MYITCGLPASGKTKTSEQVARITGFRILRSDLLRLEILRNEDVFDERVASDMGKRYQVYDEMFRLTDQLCAKGEDVILDATFVSQALRKRAAEIAAKYGKNFFIQEILCPDEVCLRRIRQRSKGHYESNAISEEAYHNNKRRYEKVDLKEIVRDYPGLEIHFFQVDTSKDSLHEWRVVEKTVLCK
ncbi:MAG: ATP-binding protein [Deltaproteobacteria bacterium]|nr:ATP-binding protein [Deltaproteobacteria bacterium]MBW2015337.1 ATP-binding protein [Deltaproteobacteria bacterium]MBW2128198.1 ATP-binding protein [Deltaproteobacteria bacterium]MBW2303085.1 ATP-binding protein [Deltaproteobacteria bacterium]